VEDIDTVGEFAEELSGVEVNVKVTAGIELGGDVIEAIWDGGLLGGRRNGSGGYRRLGGGCFNFAATGQKEKAEGQEREFPERGGRNHAGHPEHAPTGNKLRKFEIRNSKFERG
jgi:hypothetical protein